MCFLQRVFRRKKERTGPWSITGNTAELEQTKLRLRHDFINGNITAGEYAVLMEQIARLQRGLHAPRA